MAVGSGTVGIKFTVGARNNRALGMSFNIDRIDVLGVPIPQNVHNEFDEFGLVNSLKRLPGEKNRDYKDRLMSVFVDKASSTYKGLINGITRELGLELTRDIIVTISRNIDGTSVGANPVIEFVGPEVKIWADIMTDDEPYVTINRFALNIQELINAINSTPYFDAVIGDDTNPFDRAMRLLNQTNLTPVSRDALSGSIRFGLRRQNIVEGTAIFSDTVAFAERVASVGLVTSSGKYFLDNVTGLVTAFTSPDPASQVRYKYLKDPMELFASPVIIHNLQADNFRRLMFEQIELDDGSFAHGLPTQLGTDLICELQSVFPMYYAE